MSISLRNDIFQSIKSALETINGTGGYNLDVATVGTSIKDPDALGIDEFPALFLIDSSETKNDKDVDALECRVSFIVSGYVKELNSETDLGAEIRKLLADVEKAVCTDRYRGQLAINTIPRDIKTDPEVFRPYGIFDFTFDVVYNQKYGDPTVNG